MADIITFRPRERNDAAQRGDVTASVIIFPGVRYERPIPDEARAAPSETRERSGRRGRRRRSIQ